LLNSKKSAFMVALLEELDDVVVSLRPPGLALVHKDGETRE
jgi:hypothetical protein